MYRKNKERNKEVNINKKDNSFTQSSMTSSDKRLNSITTDIQVDKLRVAYDKINIIKDMTLAIPKGKITIIIGANGCGKSTLLKTMARILHPKSGTIKLKGKEITRQQPKEVAKMMAVLPQSPTTPTGLLVKELVSYGRYPHQKTMQPLNQHDYDMVDWAIKVVGLEAFAERPLESLSGGQRQRAWIAMALAQETEILLLDEPTTYLDMAHQLEILLLLQKLNKEENRTIVMVLHELNNAARFADHIVGVKDGEVICEGAPLDVINEENLRIIYGIDANIVYDHEHNCPVCMSYDMEYARN